MRETPLFDISIELSVDYELAWVDDDVAAEFDLEGNERYCDLRPLDWSDVAISIERDREAIAEYRAGEAIRVTKSPPSGPPLEVEVEDDDPFEELNRARDDLDPGVGGVVAALAASGCVPFTSCNGGALGGRHNASYPLVRFFARADEFPKLIECATAAGVGIDVDSLGRAEIMARKIEHMVAFAEAVVSRLGPGAE